MIACCLATIGALSCFAQICSEPPAVLSVDTPSQLQLADPRQSMYGTLLDRASPKQGFSRSGNGARTEKVFEHLVQRCLPMLHDHFAENDIQLSVVSLPWFMSLFISSMPLIFVRYRCMIDRNSF